MSDMTPEEQLDKIKADLERGVASGWVGVREFLGWFEFERRGSQAVRHIRQMLLERELETEPDFESEYIDGQIRFVKAGSKEPERSPQAFRIGQLESANRSPVHVKPDTPVATAITLMLTHDYSQLPVMTTEREVKGMLSWKSIGSRLGLRQKCGRAGDCLEPPIIVEIEDSIFSVISHISEHDAVLVRSADRTICGIVTASDFADQFRKLAEPFLLIGEIENSVRKLIHGKFTAAQLREARDPDDKDRKVSGVSDLTFGEYIRLLDEEKRWKRVGLELDRTEVVKRLNEVREIRNDVMHFDPEGIDEQQMRTLQAFSRFLNELRVLGAIG